MQRDCERERLHRRASVVPCIPHSCADRGSSLARSCPPLQMNLYDAVRRTISLTAPGGKTYRLRDDSQPQQPRLAVMLVRPRG